MEWKKTKCKICGRIMEQPKRIKCWNICSECKNKKLRGDKNA